MVTLEQVEKLMERTNVSYEEARSALDETGGDMLEALVTLEKRGKVVSPPGGGFYTSGKQEKAKKKQEYKAYADEDGVRASHFFHKLWKGFVKIFNKGNKNYLEVRRNDSTLIQIPITLLVLLVVFAFWITIPLMIVGLFFQCRYVFVGKDIEKTPANQCMNTVNKVAEDVKSSFQTSTENREKTDDRQE